MFNNMDFVCKENSQTNILEHWNQHHMAVTRSTASQTSPRHSVHTTLGEYVYLPGGHLNLSLSGSVHHGQGEEGSVNGEYTASV